MTTRTCRRCGGSRDPIANRGGCLRCGASGRVNVLNAAEMREIAIANLTEKRDMLADERTRLDARIARTGRPATRVDLERIARLEAMVVELEQAVR